MTSPPRRPASTIRLTAFVPPPPAPTTLMTARYEDSTIGLRLLSRCLTRPRLKQQLSVFARFQPQALDEGKALRISCQRTVKVSARNRANPRPSRRNRGFMFSGDAQVAVEGRRQPPIAGRDGIWTSTYSR